jgi:hypothetical protein
MFRDATAIAGIGETAYTKTAGTMRTELDLVAARGMLEPLRHPDPGAPPTGFLGARFLGIG